MQTYQSTPDYYRDVIQHGWAKDATSRVHKYIERHRGKNGKWVYVYRKAKNLYERGKRQVGLRTGKYSDVNEDWIKTNKSYMQDTERSLQKSGKGRIITAGPTKKKPYQHFQDNVTDNARTSHYDKHSKFERQSGYAMNGDPRYRKIKKRRAK